MADVIVIGGGPAGSYAALALARAGVSTLVLESKKEIGLKVSCTGIVSLECANRFQLGKHLVLRQAKNAMLFSPGGNVITVERPQTQACILDRLGFDRFFAQRAQDAGAEYRLESPVSAVTTGDRSVAITVSRGGKQETLTAKAAVLASGFSTNLQQSLGLGGFADFTAGAQTEVATRGVSMVEVYFGRHIAPGFFAWLVPTSETTARVGLLSRTGPTAYLQNFLQILTAKGKILPAEAKIHHGSVPLRSLPRSYTNRVVAVGDAAGQVKPTTGGGIYFGLLAAQIAADTLAGALADGDFSAKRLAGYERAWKKLLGRELISGYRARSFFERLSDARLDNVFSLISSTGLTQKLANDPGLSFDWHNAVVSRVFREMLVQKALSSLDFPFRSSWR
ncbi:NAD(P)/FAD-dependent oxidoreductase [Chloroflexota bacterium]